MCFVYLQNSIPFSIFCLIWWMWPENVTEIISVNGKLNLIAANDAVTFQIKYNCKHELHTLKFINASISFLPVLWKLFLLVKLKVPNVFQDEQVMHFLPLWNHDIILKAQSSHGFDHINLSWDQKPCVCPLVVIKKNRHVLHYCKQTL